MSYGYYPNFSFIRTLREWRRWAQKHNLINCLVGPKNEEVWKKLDSFFDRPEEFPFAVHIDIEEGSVSWDATLTYVTKETIEKMSNMLISYNKKRVA